MILTGKTDKIPTDKINGTDSFLRDRRRGKQFASEQWRKLRVQVNKIVLEFAEASEMPPIE